MGKGDSESGLSEEAGLAELQRRFFPHLQGAFHDPPMGRPWLRWPKDMVYMLRENGRPLRLSPGPEQEGRGSFNMAALKSLTALNSPPSEHHWESMQGPVQCDRSHGGLFNLVQGTQPSESARPESES